MELKPKATEKKKDGFRERLDAQLSDLLEPDETLAGVCAASSQKGLFSSGVVALVVTDRRLLVQTLDRRGAVKEGQVVSIRPEEIESVKAGGVAGAWDSPASMLMDNSTIKLKLKLTNGDKHRFTFMDGSGPLGLLGGGESQHQGSAALMAFLGRSGSRI